MPFSVHNMAIEGQNYPNTSEYVALGVPFIDTGYIQAGLVTLCGHYVKRIRIVRTSNSLIPEKIKMVDLLYRHALRYAR